MKSIPPLICSQDRSCNWLLLHKWRRLSPHMKTILLLFLFTLSAWGTPNPLYFSQNGSGSMSGADASDCEPLSFVNNWSGIPDGTTLILVGLCSYTSIQGNNITLLIPGGSGISQGAYHGIGIQNGLHGITIDGTGGGFIACTANGSTLANHTAYHGIVCPGSVYGLVVKNIAITNIYVHTLPTDIAIPPDECCGIYANQLSGSNFFGGILFSNVGTAILTQGNCTETISNCTFQCCNHAIYPSDTPGATTVVIENNFFGSCSNWDTTANTYHNDGIIWGTSSGTVASISLTGNIFNGDMGANNTAYVFFFANPALYNLFANNLFIVHPGNMLNDGCIVANGANGFIVNNTFIGNGMANSGAITSTGNGVTIENNLWTGFTTFLNLSGPVGANNVISHNLYANWTSGGNSPWTANGTVYNSFPAWKPIVPEMSSMYTTGQVANSDGTVPTNSPAIGAGTNLSSLFQTDIAGAPRTNSGPWVIGAFTSTAAPTGPLPWNAALRVVQPGTASSTPTSTNLDSTTGSGGTTNGAAVLMAEWTFNDGSGSTAADSSGNGDTATLVNSPAWVRGESTSGFALSFDGASQYMTAANPLGSFANFSYSCWIKCRSQASSTVLACGYIGFAFYAGTPHRVTFITDGSFYDGAVSSAITDDGNWHCIVGTCSGNSLAIYVDGVQTGGATVSSARGSGNITVGWDNGALFGYFPGTVDDVRVYSQALSATNVAALYSAGAQ
jgi:hypothetical protein